MKPNRRIRSSAMIGAALAAGWGSLPSALGQTVLNPGFEQTIASGGGWVGADAANVDWIKSSSKEPSDSGSYCVLMDVDKKTTSGMELYQQVTGLVAGAKYTLTGAMRVVKEKSVGCSSDTGFQVNVRDSKYSADLVQFVQDGKTDWRPFALSFTAPTDGNVWVAMLPNGIKNGEAYYDSLALVPTPGPGAMGYKSAVLGLKPVVYLRLDETSGSVFKDSSGYGRDAKMQNSPMLALPSAVSGDACAYFDGVENYATVNVDLSTWLSKTASLSFWIRTVDNGKKSGEKSPAVTGYDTKKSANDCIWGWIGKKGRIGMTMGKEDLEGETDITDNTWHHIVLTRDHVSGKAEIYEDGELADSDTLAKGVIGVSFANIGRADDHKGKDQYLDAMLDEVAVFDFVLSAAQVKQLASGATAVPRVVVWDEVSPQ
ncbi:MAG TPA: LamG domain-containing protein [Phycisphaerales bacterium]|nr:LamG domain-containing protein [Phycisphaerales bacterium]